MLLKRSTSMMMCLIGFLAAGSMSVNAAKQTTITFFEPWGLGSDLGKGFVAAAAEFEKQHPNYKVKIVPGADLNKLLTSMAGGVSPDVALTDERISSYALLKVMNPIDDLIKASNISPNDFYAPSWKECVWLDKVWAMPWGSDANFGFFWNKGMFKELGLDPEEPPKTIAEIETVFPKFTKKDNNDRLRRVALVPWDTGYGGSNAMYTWGWCFGGEFYDEKNQKVTANNPKVVKALEWMSSVATRFGGQSKVSAIANGIKGGLNLFGGQAVGMGGYTTYELKQVKKLTKIDVGVTQMPIESPGIKPAWIGGHKILIPLGTKNRKAAWDLVKFLTADPVGSAIPQTFIGSTPAYKKSNIYDRYRKDPVYVPYMKILESAVHQRPVMPVSDKYSTELSNAMASVLAGKKEARPALTECTVAVQKELDRVLARYHSRTKK